MFRFNRTIRTLFLVLMAFQFMPIASANPDHGPFPNVTFKVFNDFVKDHFSSHVSLATVLTVLFTMTSNPDLLSLHACQQHPKVQGEINQINSGWIKALAHALENRLGDATETLFRRADQKPLLDPEEVTSQIGLKLDSLSKILNLNPYDKQGCYLGKLKPISEK